MGKLLYISEDGENLTGSSQGSDVSEQGEVTIDGQKLYNLVMHDGYGNHQLVLFIIGLFSLVVQFGWHGYRLDRSPFKSVAADLRNVPCFVDATVANIFHTFKGTFMYFSID